MLGKLMKYDLRSLFKSLTPIYLIGLILAGSSRGISALASKWPVFGIPSGFLLAFFIIGMIAIPMYAFFQVISKYYKTMAKDEGYLTHTLPVKKSTLINSKIIDAFIVMMTSLLIVFACVTVRIIGLDGVTDILSEIWKGMTTVLGTSFIVITIICCLVQTITSISTIFTAISLGQKHNSNKAVMAFVYYLAIYYINQVIALVFLILPIFLNKSWWNALNSEIPDISFMNGYMLAALALNVVLAGIYYFINVKTLTNKLNLE